MSVTPADFLACAEAHAQHNDEMSKRNAISRAYYAAFHKAQEKFPLPKTTNMGMGIHSSYIDNLIETDKNSESRRIGLKLKTLHSRRARADYNITQDLPTADTAMQIAAAKELFTFLS